MDIKEIVKDNTVHFARYRQGYVYYTVRVPSAGIDYVFPVPLSDIGDATLLAKDKAMVFMRYIRQALEDTTLIKDDVLDTIESMIAKLDQQLSLQRAETVSKALIQRSVKSGRLSIKGMGRSQPLGSNDTEEGRARNRRT